MRVVLPQLVTVSESHDTLEKSTSVSLSIDWRNMTKQIQCRFCQKKISANHPSGRRRIFCHMTHYMAWRFRNKFFHLKEKREPSFLNKLIEKEKNFKEYLERHVSLSKV